MNQLRIASLVTALASILAMPASPALELPLIWEASSHTFTESGPSVADIDGDGAAEVIVAGREELIAYGPQGKEKWRWPSTGRLMTYPAILPRPDGAYIYVADFRGTFTCVDSRGNKVWEHKLDAPSSWSATAIADLTGDGTMEVVQTDEKGNVWALDAESGNLVWRVTLEGQPVSPAVADLNGDGKAEIAVATGNGLLFLLDSAGATLWQQPLGGASPTWATCAPVIYTDAQGNGRVLAASNGGAVYCFDAAGEQLWRREVRGGVSSTISVADFDADGKTDIFAATQLGSVYRFAENGAVVWDIDMQGRCLAAGAIIDADADGKLEYLLCTQNGNLLAFDQAGAIVFNHQFDTRTINVTPAFGDIVPKTKGLEFAITGGESGKVFCFGSQAAKDAPGTWSAYRGNEQKSGAWTARAGDTVLTMHPVNLSWDNVLSGEDLRFDIHNPTPTDQPLLATATCRRPDGTLATSTSRILGPHGAAWLPLQATVPEAYEITWKLADASGKTLVEGTKTLDVAPFEADRAIATRATAALRDAVDAVRDFMPLSASALSREADLLELDATRADEAFRKAAGGGPAAEEEALRHGAALVASAKRSIVVAKTIADASALNPAPSLLVFEAQHWENRDVDMQLPDAALSSLSIARAAITDEHEPISLGLFNVLDRPLNVRALVESDSPLSAITLHRSLNVASSVGNDVWDALPELDDSNTITIPPLTTGELWVDVDTAGLSPGKHTYTLRLLALNGSGMTDAPHSAQDVTAPESRVELTINVLPFGMASADVMRVCMWAKLDPPAIADMLDHGVTVFVVYPGKSSFDANGVYTGTDWSRVDEVLNQLKGHDVFPLVSGIPRMHSEPGSATYGAEMKAYLADLVAHLAEFGIGKTHFALYPIDEPGGNGWAFVNQLVEFGKVARAADPEIQIYMDGGGELPMFEAMAPYIDVWTPGIVQLMDKTPEMDLVRRTGKTLWSYDCAYAFSRPTGPNAKDINIPGQYRSAALFALRHGCTGIGYWSYNIGPDMWQRTQFEYTRVYEGRTKPVTSRGWEAIREGIEDTRILAALRDRAEDPTSPIDASLRDRIDALINVKLPALVDPANMGVRLSVSRQALDMLISEDHVRAFRNELIACVRSLATADS